MMANIASIPMTVIISLSFFIGCILVCARSQVFEGEGRIGRVVMFRVLEEWQPGTGVCRVLQDRTTTATENR